MKKTFFAKYAMFILLVVCFLTPLVLRGARDALRDMKNDVKDWLPSRFRETGEIEWFWKHFAGERFIIVTWPKCTGKEDDQAYALFKKKLFPAIPPSKQNTVFPEPPQKDVGATWLVRPYTFIGDVLGLYTVKNDHFNWSGQNEKWLRGFDGIWYYITPAGDLYEFKGSDAPISVLFRGVLNALGQYHLTTKHLASFGPGDGPWYYTDPSRLQAQFFRSVVTGPDVLRDLTQPEVGVLRDDPKEAMDRLKGALFGPDGEQTALIVTLTDAGLRDFHRVLGRNVLGKELGQLYKIADECGIAPTDLHMGGPPVDNVAIDEEGSITLLRLVSACVVLGLGLAYACFRSILATLAVFFTGGISAAMGMSFVGWTGESADAVMMSMPALVYVLGISGAVHYINYYREAVDEHGFVGACERALKHAWKPAILCNVTTAIGLLSLYTSEIIPIRKFGLYSALGVMGTSILIFTLLPAALQVWPLRLPKQNKRDDGAESELDAMLSGYWERFGRCIIRHHWGVALGCILVIASVGAGVTRINTSVNLLDLFDPNAKILSDYAWIEDNLGMLVPMEVVVKFQPETMRQPEEEPDEGAPATQEDRYRLAFLERVEAVDTVQREIDEHFGEKGAGVVGRSMSAVTFSPELPPATAGFVRRRALNNGLEKHRDEFLRSDYLRIDKDDQSELWRISLRVAAFRGVDYGDFVQDLRSIVEPVLAAQNARQEIVRNIVEQREKQPDAVAKKSSVFEVSVIVPDELHEAISARLAREREATRKKKPGEKKSEDESSAPAAAVARTKTADVQINHESVFVRTLLSALKPSNTRVLIKPASLKAEDAEKLANSDFVLTVGKMPKNVQEILQARADTWLPAERFLVEAKKSALDSSRSHQPVAAVYTGVVPIVYKAQRTLLDSLISSTVWSFLTITPLMMMVCKNVWGGLVAMLPNALPVLVIFGAMGLIGIRVDIGSMMTASIALGVAVDDTIHYLTWFREELDRLGDRHKAILAAYKRCATPTFQAAIISGLGLSIFALSTFTPTQRFGYLMLTILFAGVVAELVFYPALLAGPLGAVFKPRRKVQRPHDETPTREPDLPPTLLMEGAKARPTAKRIALLSPLWTLLRSFWT